MCRAGDRYQHSGENGRYCGDCQYGLSRRTRDGIGTHSQGNH